MFSITELPGFSFQYDLVSLLPLELFYFKFGPISVFRLPRLLKVSPYICIFEF